MKSTRTVLIFSISILLLSCASQEKKIEQEREKNPKYQYNVGIVYLNNGQPDEAIKYLRKALSLQPKFDLAFDGMGLAYSMKGDFAEAIKYYSEALTANPSLTDAHNHLATAYQEQGLLDNAEKHFLAAVDDETYHSRELPLYNLARLFYLKEENEKALEYVSLALNIKPEFAMGHNLKGLVHERFKDYRNAIISYQAAIKILPDDINLKYNLAGAFFKHEDYEKAKDLFTVLQSKVTGPEMRANIIKYLDMIEKEIR
jgi:tetratricopeptide (TPR) repeat protein